MALQFVQRYRGMLVIDRTIIREFLNPYGGHKAAQLKMLIHLNAIQVMLGASQSQSMAIAHLLGRTADNDTQIIATARLFDLRLASGDRNLVVGAARLGLDVRAFRFAGTLDTRLNYLRRVIRTLKINNVSHPGAYVIGWR